MGFSHHGNWSCHGNHISMLLQLQEVSRKRKNMRRRQSEPKPPQTPGYVHDNQPNFSHNMRWIFDIFQFLIPDVIKANFFHRVRYVNNGRAAPQGG